MAVVRRRVRRLRTSWFGPMVISLALSLRLIVRTVRGCWDAAVAFTSSMWLKCLAQFFNLNMLLIIPATPTAPPPPPWRCCSDVDDFLGVAMRNGLLRPRKLAGGGIIRSSELVPRLLLEFSSEERSQLRLLSYRFDKRNALRLRLLLLLEVMWVSSWGGAGAINFPGSPSLALSSARSGVFSSDAINCCKT